MYYYLITMPKNGHSRVVLDNNRLADLIHHYRMRFTDQKMAIVSSRIYISHKAYSDTPKSMFKNVALFKPEKDYSFTRRVAE